jgi:hypothetical protein
MLTSELLSQLKLIENDRHCPASPDLLKFVFRCGWLRNDEYNFLIKSQKFNLSDLDRQRVARMNAKIIRNLNFNSSLSANNKVVQIELPHTALKIRPSQQKQQDKGKIKNLWAAVKKGDGNALSKFRGLLNQKRFAFIAKKFLWQELKKGRGKGGRIARANLPIEGHPVQGGAPGLGKRA